LKITSVADKRKIYSLRFLISSFSLICSDENYWVLTNN